MPGWDKDPILRPCPTPLPPLNQRKKKQKKTKTKTKSQCYQRKEKSKKKKKKIRLETLKEVGQFCPNIVPNFLSNLERLYFEGGEEKTCGPHHFSLPLPLSTKHPSHSFSLLFSTLFLPSSLKSI